MQRGWTDIATCVIGDVMNNTRQCFFYIALYICILLLQTLPQHQYLRITPKIIHAFYLLKKKNPIKNPKTSTEFIFFLRKTNFLKQLATGDFITQATVVVRNYFQPRICCPRGYL